MTTETTEHPTCNYCGGYTDTAPDDCTDDDYICFGTAHDCLRVAAAAITAEDGTVFSLPPPARHCDVIRLMASKGVETMGPRVVQGFLLSNGQFANRVKAKAVAIRAEQQIPRAMNLRELYSEDVW